MTVFNVAYIEHVGNRNVLRILTCQHDRGSVVNGEGRELEFRYMLAAGGSPTILPSPLFSSVVLCPIRPVVALLGPCPGSALLYPAGHSHFPTRSHALRNTMRLFQAPYAPVSALEPGVFSVHPAAAGALMRPVHRRIPCSTEAFKALVRPFSSVFRTEIHQQLLEGL